MPLVSSLSFILQVSIILPIFTTICELINKPLSICRLDYCGISLLIAGSIVPCLYYGFYCFVPTQIFYISFTALLCAASVIVSLSEKFSDIQYRSFRAIVFTSYGLSGVIPALHWYIIHYFEQATIDLFRNSAHLLVLMAVLYIIGVTLYALRIPECWFPGKFDFYVSSLNNFLKIEN